MHFFNGDRRIVHWLGPYVGQLVTRRSDHYYFHLHCQNDQVDLGQLLDCNRWFLIFDHYHFWNTGSGSNNHACNIIKVWTKRDTKFSETETKTLFPRPNFPKPKPILFFRDQIFRNQNRDFFPRAFLYYSPIFCKWWDLGRMTSIYIDIGGIHPTSNRQTPTDHSSHFIAYYDISVPKSKFLESDLHVESKSERN